MSQWVDVVPDATVPPGVITLWRDGAVIWSAATMPDQAVDFDCLTVNPADFACLLKMLRGKPTAWRTKPRASLQ